MGGGSKKRYKDKKKRNPHTKDDVSSTKLTQTAASVANRELPVLKAPSPKRYV